MHPNAQGLPPSSSGFARVMGCGSSANADGAPAIIARAGTVFTNVLRSMEHPPFLMDTYRYALSVGRRRTRGKQRRAAAHTGDGVSRETPSFMVAGRCL